MPANEAKEAAKSSLTLRWQLSCTSNRAFLIMFLEAAGVDLRTPAICKVCIRIMLVVCRRTNVGPLTAPEERHGSRIQ